MRCIHTGAHVLLASHDEWLYGDVFLTTRGDLLMRVCDRRQEPIIKVKHFTIMNYDIWFDETKTSGEFNSTLIAEGYITHGYKGIQI